jgi:hypothetical protein
LYFTSLPTEFLCFVFAFFFACKQVFLWRRSSESVPDEPLFIIVFCYIFYIGLWFSLW